MYAFTLAINFVFLQSRNKASTTQCLASTHQSSSAKVIPGTALTYVQTLHHSYIERWQWCTHTLHHTTATLSATIISNTQSAPPRFGALCSSDATSTSPPPEVVCLSTTSMAGVRTEEPGKGAGEGGRVQLPGKSSSKKPEAAAVLHGVIFLWTSPFLTSFSSPSLCCHVQECAYRGECKCGGTSWGSTTSKGCVLTSWYTTIATTNKANRWTDTRWTAIESAQTPQVRAHKLLSKHGMH